MKYYFAGPLFTLAERNFNKELVNVLRTKYKLDIFMPQENDSNSNTALSLFKMCIDGINNSDAIIAIMDGPDPDSGTSFECGYAYANKKPIFTIRTDFRSSGDTPDSTSFNLMLSQSSKVILINSLSDPTIETIADVINNKALNK